MKKRILSVLLVLAGVATAWAAPKTVKGVVVDQTNQPVIGASVQVNGTSIGVVTDFDGTYELTNVPDNAVITFSFIGMKSKEVKVTDSVLNVQLVDDLQKLDEVVVIGYGAAKAKDLTSPITVVKGDELLSTPSTSPMSAIQGKVAGVNVVNSGAPGAGPRVSIRGNGSFTNSSPLYVVDGMFYDDINFLNNSDIQEMSVLKDASAAAIYGVRAANGVVIITTKKGKRNQNAKITYNGYVGVQSATNVLKMANSEQYAQMLLEANYDAYVANMKASIDRYGGSYADADFHNWTFGANTDWYNELLRKAVITNHSIGISGGSEKAVYSLGVSYLYQDGIMDADNNYKRMNFRAAVDYDATSWLKVGFSGVFSNSTQINPNNAAWKEAFNSPSIYPVYDENNAEAFPEKFASPASVGFTSNFYNPVATAKYNNSRNENYQVLSNFYAQFNILPERLNFKTNYSYDYTGTRGRSYIKPYYVSSWQQKSVSELTKSTTNYYNYIWDNTLTYNDKFGDHKVGAMLGYSMRQQQYRYLWGKASNVPEGKDEYMYLGQGDADGVTLGDDGYCYRGQSYFARLNYDYAGKYLLMFTMRADGSSKYQEQWGYFPSVGAAWVMSQESFMQNQKAFDYLKLRASWGRLGNDHVAASDGFASINTGNGASGVFGNTTIPGFQNTSYFSYLKWELVDEANVGVNFSTLNNRLNVDLDWYHRMTKRAVISPRLPFSNDVLAGNYGKILNTGFDVAATWSDRIGNDFKYSIGLNMSFLKNRVKDLGGTDYVKGGKTINMVGEEMNSFYGFKVVGIYQNDAECAADPIAVANGLVPGDFKYEDVNGDNVIDGNDRQTLGAYIPNLTYGVNLGFSWKNLDFELTTYGQAGAQMYNRKRALRYSQSNFNFDESQYKNRWTGEGSTNEHPSAAALVKGWNVSDQKVNSYFVESADFFRIQNITLAYNFRNLKMGNYTLPGLRLSLTADRPFTTFSANAFTPELSDSEGWDVEVYPLTSTYTFGVQIDF
ncbi:MAG: TonB-dependent receptor [Muribaculaceae bacterium]|nr:TonB-dependent receptor [Muribaculaceae bacterium]